MLRLLYNIYSYFSVYLTMTIISIPFSLLYRFSISGKLRHRLKGLKDPSQRRQRFFLMTQKDPHKGFHKDVIRYISLKQFWKINPKHHVAFLRPWRHKTCFLKRGKVVKLQPKYTCHHIVSQTVWIVN